MRSLVLLARLAALGSALMLAGCLPPTPTTALWTTTYASESGVTATLLASDVSGTDTFQTIRLTRPGAANRQQLVQVDGSGQQRWAVDIPVGMDHVSAGSAGVLVREPYTGGTRLYNTDGSLRWTTTLGGGIEDVSMAGDIAVIEARRGSGDNATTLRFLTVLDPVSGVVRQSTLLEDVLQGARIFPAEGSGRWRVVASRYRTPDIRGVILMTLDAQGRIESAIPVGDAYERLMSVSASQMVTYNGLAQTMSFRDEQGASWWTRKDPGLSSLKCADPTPAGVMCMGPGGDGESKRVVFLPADGGEFSSQHFPIKPGLDAPLLLGPDRHALVVTNRPASWISRITAAPSYASIHILDNTVSTVDRIDLHAGMLRLVRSDAFLGWSTIYTRPGYFTHQVRAVNGGILVDGWFGDESAGTPRVARYATR